MTGIRFAKPEDMRTSDGILTFHGHETWDRIHADVVRKTRLKRQETNLLSDQHLIFLNIRGTARAGENYLDGRRVSFVARPEGSLVYVPPGCNWTGWDEGDPTASYLSIAIEKAFVDDLFPTQSTLATLQPDLGFKDLAVQAAAHKILSEVRNPDQFSHLVVKGQAIEIVAGLLRRNSSFKGATKGRLSPAVLKRVLALMDASTDRKLDLQVLSAEAGMSVSHFCRAFKTSTGKSPEAYLYHHRVERASELLRTPQQSVTQIALECGFNSGSHLSTRFHRQMGMSPTNYRRGWSH